ncbi:MAG: NAD(P)H-dependent oxidoreductase [bacterium]|nr:NAD(P)H-dependent oxidoreductase [bacterium]
MSFLAKLNWRYATKKFNPDKKVSVENREKILEAIRMAPSSFGLQPLRVFVITNPALREKLKAAAWIQPQMTDSAFLLVFCSRSDMKDRAERYHELASHGDADKKEQASAYIKVINNFVNGMDQAQTESWATKQLYLALGFAVAAAAELGLDSCPLEGFDRQAFDQILNLPDNLRSQVTLAVGYRSDADVPKEKIRFPEVDLFTFLD